MVLATLVLICAIPQAASDSAKVVATQATVEAAKSSDNPSVNLPASPAPKLESNDATDSDSAKLGVSSTADTLAAAIQPAAPAAAIRPGIKPTIAGEYPQHKLAWYGLMAVGHGAATFDAYSTRRALSGNYGTEGNPLLRPFAHSNAMYAATQVSPFVMDFVGRKMMTSSHPWMRKLWWLPQTAGASVSFVSAAHNMSVVP